MIKAIRTDGAYKVAPRGKEFLDTGEKWWYVPERKTPKTRDRLRVDYHNLEEELSGMGISAENC